MMPLSITTFPPFIGSGRPYFIAVRVLLLVLALVIAAGTVRILTLCL